VPGLAVHAAGALPWTGPASGPGFSCPVTFSRLTSWRYLGVVLNQSAFLSCRSLPNFSPVNPSMLAGSRDAGSHFSLYQRGIFNQFPLCKVYEKIF
jgi:hypothetical protein